MKLIYRIAVIALLVAILVSVLIRNKNQIAYQSGTAKQVISEIPVDVKPAKRSQPTIVIQTAGMVESTEEVVVVSSVQGSVKSVNISVGTAVNEGELLVTVDDYYALKEYSIAREAYEQIQKDYQRARELSSEKAVTGQQLEQLRLQMDAADVKQQSLQRRLDDTRIKAPVSGIINQVFVKKGGMLGNGSPICEIVNPSGLKITAHVTERDLEFVKVGQTVTLFENSNHDNPITGVVTGIGVKPDRTGQYPLAVSLPAKVKDMKPGILLNADIKASTDTAIVVHRRIISTYDGSTGIYISVNDKAVFRKIVTGFSFGDSTEVVSGIEEGDLLITNGYQSLHEGDQLKIVKQ